MTDAASPPSSKRPNDAAAATAGGDASASASASANAEPFVGTPVSASKRRYVDPRAPPTRRGRGRSTRRREVFEQFETTRALLSRWTIGEFLRTYRGDAPRLVTTLSIDDTVGDALATLARENILSAPVVDKDACLFLGFHDVSDFLCGLVVFLERTKPPPPLPAEVARLETEMDARATRSDEELKTLHDLKDESRRTWIASITADELATAGRAFCETALGDLRERLSGNEDGRMVYQGKSETPMLDLVRAGFLRVIVAPGHDADEAACVAAREDEDDANRGSDAKPKPGEWAAVNRAEGEGGKTIERIPGEGPGPGPGPRGPPSVAAIPRRATYCHRVAVYRLAYDASVMDDTMIIDAVVSQSDVIRFLDAHQKDLGEVTRRNLLEIGLVDDAAVAQNRGDVVCVLPTTRTLEAFSLMYSEGVSAVGVVAEPRGKLVDVLSVSDLRGFVKLPTLDLSVEEFKSLDARHRSYPGGDANVVSVRPDADIGDVLSKMAARKVHHVFVTDLDGAPIGMITPTDILSAMSLPSTEGIGWRFQSAELHSIYAWE